MFEINPSFSLRADETEHTFYLEMAQTSAEHNTGSQNHNQKTIQLALHTWNGGLCSTSETAVCRQLERIGMTDPVVLQHSFSTAERKHHACNHSLELFFRHFLLVFLLKNVAHSHVFYRSTDIGILGCYKVYYMKMRHHLLFTDGVWCITHTSWINLVFRLIGEAFL